MSDAPRTHDVVVLRLRHDGGRPRQDLSAAGLSVTAWNRTDERARALEGPSITAIEDLDEAIATSPLVVACVDTVETARALLDSIRDWRGATVANLVSTTSRQTEELAATVEGRNGRYLDGSIMCYPEEVGTSDAFFAYSGPAEALDEAMTTLSVLSPATVRSSSLGMASTLMAGVTAFYVPSLSAYVAAVTFLLREGASAEDIRRGRQHSLHLLRRHLDEAVTSIDSGHHETDQATVEVFAKGIRTRLPEYRAAGHSMRLVEATLENLDAAEAAGLGHLDFYVQTKVL